MFHVKHYSGISQFYSQNSSNVDGFVFESLTDLVYSSKLKKIFFYEDSIYSKVIDAINLDWENDHVLVLGPLDQYSKITPPGFNMHNVHSIEYFTKMYSAFKNDIQAIFCAVSQKDIVINREHYNIFEINLDSQYDDVANFLEKNYQLVNIVDDIGQYAKRGGIIDIYSDAHLGPKRISFLDEKTQIKTFDIHTQRSLKLFEKIKIPILEKSKTLKEDLEAECGSWKKYKITRDSLVINNDANNNNIVSPFKKVDYSNFKKLKNKYNVSYENINRLNGFLYGNKIFAPSWVQKKSNKGSDKGIVDIAEISIVDYVIHRDHGVGKFAGFKYFEDSIQELMIIKYKDNGIVSVDISHIDKVTFYGSKNDLIELDSLSRPGQWNRKKNLAKKNVQNIVNKLLNSYVNRENSYREPLVEGNEENQFIQEFKYVETHDQAQCWEDIKNDLKLHAPMDRLICGDVGFGKTEIAIRAAYRYIQNNKKVIVLAPTTILCEQLYRSFSGRLTNHYIVVDRVSRLRKKQEIDNIKGKWIDNSVDILIGTHAILYSDIYLNNCNFLIIDEEHRFGVRQKEKIKELNPSIDILTMSATPIPRTLNMALSGMKQISTLTSPPKHRKAIITNINYFNNKLIINAINNEIIRNGQVYFVHNNVNTIGSIISFLEKKLPHININYIHGQLDAKIIEKRMKNFTNKRIDVLVCTSIIENGIDIPNVNTVIINNAHKFGLSQLYQIRGRVGRSDKQAYALLIIPEKFRLNATANLRLKAIEKYTNLGSGYKISNMDLTIRGGGSMFGYDQSGNIENVGYELVSKFINEHIDDIQAKEQTINTRVYLKDKGIIPNSYIVSNKIRLLFYRKIKSAIKMEEINNLKEELLDRFGILPNDLIKILEIQKISILGKTNQINLIEEKQNKLIIHFNRVYWEQKLSYLLNKINEFIDGQAINYEIQELQESLALKVICQEKTDSLQFLNELICFIMEKKNK